MVRYSDVARKVMSMDELLTTLISDASRLIGSATRMLEVSRGIKIDEEHADSTSWNVLRTLVKRIAVLEEDLLALGYTPDQLENPKLYRAADLAQIDKLIKLQKWRPETKDIIRDVFNAEPIAAESLKEYCQTMTEGHGQVSEPNPYTYANQEDFDE